MLMQYGLRFLDYIIAATVMTVVVAFGPAARAQLVDDIDSLYEVPYVFQEDPGTTLTLDTTNFPTIATIDERGYTPTGSGFEANRHDLLFSDSGGLLSRLFDTSEAFDIAVDVTMEVGSESPRKEAGLRVNNAGFDGLFIINSDAAEIVAFGGALEFFSFDQTFGISYTLGETIQMRMVYVPPASGAAGTIEYLVDLPNDGQGAYSSGAIEFSNLEQGIIPGSEIGVYAQGAGNVGNPDDFITVTFENFDFDGPDVLDGDFNMDGVYDCEDIDALTAEIAAMTNNAAFDLTEDGKVDLDDRDAWLAVAGSVNLDSGNPYLLGDANLDGAVDVSDFNDWNSNKFTSDNRWCGGDFNADGAVDVSDFNDWNGNKFQSAENVTTVPEPTALLLLGTALAGLLIRRRA